MSKKMVQMSKKKLVKRMLIFIFLETGVVVLTDEEGCGQGLTGRSVSRGVEQISHTFTVPDNIGQAKISCKVCSSSYNISLYATNSTFFPIHDLTNQNLQFNKIIIIFFKILFFKLFFFFDPPKMILLKVC